MRALIVSDLHANLEAVRVLPTDVDQVWVLGDLVNYGPDPLEVIEYVGEKAVFVVRGNHDHSIGSGEDSRCSAQFRAMAGETGDYTRSVVNEVHKRYLRGLPLKTCVNVDGVRVLMCHAVPSDPLFEYRAEDSPLWLDDPVAPGVQVQLVGHSHLPYQRLLPHRRLVNPGSVGQPKHGRPEACYAIWQDGKITLGSAPYDVEKTIRRLRGLSLSAAVFEDLAYVLRNGRVSAPRPAASD